MIHINWQKIFRSGKNNLKNFRKLIRGFQKIFRKEIPKRDTTNTTIKRSILSSFEGESLMERYIIVHVHIFKNAGSTFDSILEKNFGKDFLDHRDDKAMVNFGIEHLRYLINENRTLKAISSHHIHFNPKDLETVNLKIIPVYFLRHPIERVLSVYKFEQKQDSITPGAIHAKKFNLNDYILWRMRDDVGKTIRNANTRYCAGRGKDVLVDEKSFEMAKRNLQNTPCVGLVDRFDESIALFKKKLSEIYPFMNFLYERQNIGQEINKTIEERLDEIKKQLEEDTWNILHRENHFDILLDIYTRELINGRASRNTLEAE